MLGKLLPSLLAVVGAVGGVGAGLALKAPEQASVEIHPCGPEGGDHEDAAAKKSSDDDHGDEENDGYDYVKLNNQFVVPVVRDSKVSALVVMSLSVEVKAGETNQVYSRQPKLRDAFLQVLLDHANTGGFDGDFTNGEAMVGLRKALKEVATKLGGPSVSDVLILEIVRQDV